jgi:hypothetical protein
MVDEKAKAKAQQKLTEDPLPQRRTKQELINQMGMEFRVMATKVEALGFPNLAEIELARQRLEESWHWCRAGIERLPESEEV